MKVNRGQDFSNSVMRVKRSDNNEELLTQSNRANSLDNQGRYQEALEIYEKINQKYRQELGADHPDTLIIKNNMALVLDHQGKYEEALKILEEVYQKQTLLLETLSALSTRNNIALVLKHKGKYQGSLELFKEVYEKRKEVLGADNPGTLATRSSIALVLDYQGKYQEALDILEEVYQKQREILGLSHLDTLSTRNGMAIVLNNQGKYKEALQAFQEVFDKRKVILEPGHPYTLYAENGIALALNNQGKYNEALQIFQEVFDKSNVILGPDHPHTLSTRNGMAIVLNNQGKYKEALQAFQEVFDKRKVILEPGHPYTLYAENGIALALNNQGKYNEALQIFQEVFDKSNVILGPDHPHTLSTRNGIALVLNNQGKYNEALQVFQEVFDKRNVILGPDHPDTLYTKNGMAIVLDNQGKYDEALQAYTETFDKSNVILGPDHPNTLFTRNGMAVVLDNQGKYDEALQAYQEVCIGFEKVFGQDYPYTLTAKGNIAVILDKQGKYDQALRTYKEVCGGFEKVLGSDHPDTLLMKNNMAAVLDKQGKYGEALQTYKEVLDIEKITLGEDHPDTLATKNNIALLDKKIHSLSATCLTGNRRKRDINNCQFLWEDIDQFNKEKSELRNPNKIEIDSEKFIAYIRDIDESKRTQLVQLADQVKVTGKFQGLVNSLVSNQKVMNHLSRVQRVSGMTMHEMIAKNALADFLNDDYEGVAINIGFVAGGRGFAKVAEAASIKGAGLIADGKLMLGRSLKAASPFLVRGTLAFVAYDLVDQMKALRAGNKDALVGVVGDGIYLGVDTAEIGVEVAEVLGLLEGVSSITGPIGAAVGTLVFVGTDVYLAIKRVDAIDEIIHLSGTEKFIEGLRAFIGMKPETYIEELMEEKQINDQLVKQVFEYLKQHSDIQRYVFPTGKLVVDSCHVVPRNTTVCISGEFPCSIDRRTVTYNTEKCTTKFQVDLNNTILLNREKAYDLFSKAKLDNINGGEILCSQARQIDLLKFEESMRASEVLGLDYGTALNRSLDSLVPDGYERMHKSDYLCKNAIGITDSVTKAGNYTFINLGDGNDFADGFLNSGNIFLLGNGSKKINGGKDDIFIFNGNSTTGYINGGSGTDTADLENFALDKSSIVVNLDAEFIDNSLKIVNINKILSRKGKRDEVNCACNTGYVDGRGGKSSEEKDVITIPQLNCAYKLQLVIRSNTIIYNHALEGNFSYIVPLQGGEASVNLPMGSQSQHRFRFNYTLPDISSIDVKSNNTITFNFVPTLQNGNFNITVLYDRQNTTSYLLSDNTEIKVDDKNNLYALQKSDKAINEIINDYSAIANMLKMSIFVQSILNNETAAIGHGKHDVLHNNPYYKSHLVGNGRENIFVITSGYETLGENKLPVPAVIIYDVDTENKIDTLDLRQIKQQIKRDLSREVEARIIVSNQDLLITLFCLNPVKIITTVRLKDALVSDWYDRLNVILDNVHMKIEKGIWLNSFDLKPIPLVFGEEKEIVVIKPEDIEKENKLVILRKAGGYVFARSENDLIITNAFDSNLTDNEFCTISFSKFYQEAKMQTLVIKFAEREIVLKDEMEKINNAATLEEQLDQHRNATYSAVFDDYVSSTQRKRRKVKGYEDKEFFYAQNYASSSMHVTSKANRPSSWIGDLSRWVKGKLFNEPGLFYAQNYANSSMKDMKAIPVIQEHTKNQSSGIASPEINSTTVNSIAMLADAMIRQRTGVKHGFSIGSLSKDSILKDKMDGIEKSIKRAINNDYTPEQGPRTDFKNVSTEKAVKNRGRESV